MPTASQKPLELILARNLMSALSTPAFLVDEGGILVFYNEAAGMLLGKSWEELGTVGADQQGIGVLVASACGLQQLQLGAREAHRAPFGCHSASSAPPGTATTLRQPAGPSRGSSSTVAPIPHARAVTSATLSTWT